MEEQWDVLSRVLTEVFKKITLLDSRHAKVGAERLLKRKRVVAWTKMETVERERTDP